MSYYKDYTNERLEYLSEKVTFFDEKHKIEIDKEIERRGELELKKAYKIAKEQRKRSFVCSIIHFILVITFIRESDSSKRLREWREKRLAKEKSEEAKKRFSDELESLRISEMMIREKIFLDECQKQRKRV